MVRGKRRSHRSRRTGDQPLKVIVSPDEVQGRRQTPWLAVGSGEEESEIGRLRAADPGSLVQNRSPYPKTVLRGFDRVQIRNLLMDSDFGR
jgi:hypothetical protein